MIGTDVEENKAASAAFLNHADIKKSMAELGEPIAPNTLVDHVHWAHIENHIATLKLDNHCDNYLFAMHHAF